MLSDQLSHIYNQIEKIPSSPGVYKFYDKRSQILYVGKAINLKSRVSSYFSNKHYDRPQIIPMIDLINRIDVIVTDNEVEALVLETALIKQFKPKYNSREKDDKSAAWIYITTQDEIPTIKIVRTLDKHRYKKGKFYGPYPNGRATRQIFKYIRRMHPFCTCKSPKEPCLYYHIGLCNNPAFGEFTVEEYRNEIKEIEKFLKGSKNREISRLVEKMNEYSTDMKFEEAAILRDRVEDLKHLGEKKNWYRDEDEYVKLRGKGIETELKQISQELGLDHTINRIECYDISNIQGKYAFGSMTVFQDHQVNSSLYRIFKIREKDTPDDYSMLAEVLRRRVKHLDVQGTDSLNSKPDIILIDGAAGQLNAVKEYIPSGIFLLGISKGRSLKKKGKRSKDQFWVIDGDSVSEIRLRNPKYFITLRDEAHRFSLKHNRAARIKGSKKSVLDGIEGIGPTRKRLLKKEFGTVSNMRNKSVEELDSVIKSRATSVKLYIALKKN